MMDMTSPMRSKPIVDATCKLGKKGCFEDGRCHALGECENKIVTNADHIRAMTVEELAHCLSLLPVCQIKAPDCIGKCDCEECLKEWLQQPAEVHND